MYSELLTIVIATVMLYMLLWCMSNQAVKEPTRTILLVTGVLIIFIYLLRSMGVVTW